MKTDRKTKAEKSPPKVKAVKRNGRVAPRSNGKHPLATYEHIPVGIVEASFDGKYVNVNEEFCRISGYSREELLGRGIKDCTHEDDYAIDYRLHEQLIAGKIPFYRIEKRYVRKDGGSIWVELTRSLVYDAKGKPLYTVGVVLDISDRKDVERVLRDSVERLRLATGAAQMFMWEWDFQTQSYTIADNFEQVLGFSAGLLPKNKFETLWALSPKEDVQRISESFETAVETQSDLRALPCRVINPENGQIVWLEISAKIVYDHEGKPERMFGVAQNITESQNAREEITIISRVPEENPNPVMRITTDGNVLYANPASATLLEEWRQGGKPTAPDELQNAIAQAFRSGVKTEVEVEHRGRIFSFTLAPIPEGGYVNLYGKDITERKEAEAALRRSETNLWNFLENASVGIHWVDKNGVITWANQAELEMLGYTREEYIGRPIAEFHVDEPVIEDILKRLACGETLNGYEARLRHKNGAIRYGVINSNVFWEDGKFIHTRCFTRDITERKRTEEKLRESEERFRAMVSQTTAGIAESDLNGRFVFVNPGFCQMLGYSEEELVGKTVWELTYTEDLEENQSLFQRMLEQGKSYQFEKRFIRKDGSALWTSVSVTTINDMAGKPKGGVGVMLDIEKRKQTEAALVEYARQQEALFGLSDQLHRTDSLADIFDAALDAILNALQCDRASILLFDNQDVMRFVAWRGLSDAYRKATDGHSPWKPDTKDPQPIPMDDVRTAELADSLRQVVQREGIGSLAFIPLVSNGKLIGKFMVYFNTPHTFNQGELDLSLTIARQLAAGIDRKRAEDALRESERKFNLIYENLPFAAALAKPETGVLVDINQEFEKVFGFSRQETLGKSALELGITQNLEVRQHFQNELQQRGSVRNVEVELFTRSGEKRFFISNIDIVTINEEKYLLSTLQEITERKQTEKRLALLAEISDMLRNFDDPKELMYKISEAVGEHLHVKRVLFNEIDLEHDREIVHRDYHRDLDSVAGVHKVSDYSSITSAEMAVGRTVVNTDSRIDPRTAQDYERTYAVSGERAYVVVPLMRDNRWVASFWVSDDAPRQWTSEEVSLLETVAERTWAIIEKLRINTALRESEWRFREMIDALPAAIYTTDAEGVLTHFNPAAVEFSGRTPELGTDKWCVTWKLYYPDGRPMPHHECPMGITLKEGRIVRGVEAIAERPDGSRIWFEPYPTPLLDSEGRIVGGINMLVDITERKRAEKALRESEQRYRAVVESQAEMLCRFQPDGTILFANGAYARARGTTPEELANRNFWEFVAAEDRPAVKAVLDNLTPEAPQVQIENRFHTVDGERWTLWTNRALKFDANGHLLEVQSSGIDITERKQFEEALRASEERMRLATDAAGMYTWEFDIQNQVFTPSDNLAEVTGVSPDLVLENDIDALGRLSPVEDAQIVQDALDKAFESQGNLRDLQYRIVNPDNGQMVWMEVNARTIYDREGKPERMYGVSQNITERKRIEAALRESEERYRFIVENTSDGIWWVELTEPMPISLSEEEQVDWYYKHAVMRQCNLGLARMYGYDSIEKVVGLSMRVLMPREIPSNVEMLRQFVCSSYRLVDAESRETGRDGRELVFLNNMVGIIENGKLVGEWGTNRDISERKRAEERLRASETLYRTIARSIPGGGVYVVDKDFRYLVAEGPVTEAFGLSREMLEGHTVMEVFPDERGKRMEERLRRTFTGESVNFETQFDKRYFWTQMAPVQDSIGQAIILTLDLTEHRQAEEALRQSEERFARFMQHLPGLAWIKDMDGRYVYANAAAQKAFNTPREQLYGKTDEDIFPPEIAAQFRKNDEQALADEKGVQVVETLEHMDGAIHSSLVSKFPIPGPDGSTILIGGTAFDITERLHAEEALRESEERFRAILRQATAGIVRKDPEGRLIFVNEAFCNMLGYTELDLTGKTVWEFMHPDDVEESKHSYNRLMGEGIPFKLERRFLREDGSVIWVDASVSPIVDAAGKPQSAVAVEVDITGRKLAEEALQQLNLQLEDRVLSRTAKLRAVNQTLREEIAERQRVEEALRQSEALARANEEKLSTLFELLPVGISFLAPDGQVIQVNPALTNIMKLSKEQLSNQSHRSRKYIRPNGAAMHPTEFASQRALSEGKTVYNVETGVVLEGGEVLWTSVSAAPVNVAEVGAVVVTVDITESKRAERALQESRERLQILSQRLVEVQEEERRAIARELHDRVGQTLAALNINLIIISGQLGGKVDEQVSSRLSDSMKLVAETIALVRDVMSNLRPSVLDDYGLESAIDSHLSQFKSRYEIGIRFEKPDQPIPRLGSSIEMTFLRIAQEALMNIAKHAQADQVTLSLQRMENAICMTVQDNGTGIMSWQDANRPGSHGLTIMRERAEAFGGHLMVSSIPGKGTKIEVKIPVETNDQSQLQEGKNE